MATTPNSMDYSNDPKFTAESQTNDIVIQPEDHFVRTHNSDDREYYSAANLNQSTIDYRDKHPTRYKQMQQTDTSNDVLYAAKYHDINDENGPVRLDLKGEQAYPPEFITEGDEIRPIFSGSATLINPSEHPENRKSDKVYMNKQKMLWGLGVYEDDKTAEEDKKYRNIPESEAKAPVSPFLPFTRLDPTIARKTNLIAYNRTHTPIADIEHRKSFRHIFITRPECYITCNNGGLSEQAEADEDFASIYDRMPYICELLSPRYLPSRSKLSADNLDSNWNYLLSNRVMGLNFESIENSVTENMAKSTHGFTVTPGNAQSSGKEGTITLSFRDTKHFEIYEMIRMWMLYIHKRHIGIFAPPFNGYQYHNDFNFAGAVENGKVKVNGKINLHPYDRALEYPCTIFDIVTDETDSRILHYCMYIGAYPVQMSLPLNNDLSNAINTEMRVQVSFKYSAKIINNNKTLLQFNYNAGITDDIGTPTDGFNKEVLPFLLNSEYDNISSNVRLADYIGQASLFTGSPYIVMSAARVNPVGRGVLYSPFLKFAPITMNDINRDVNLGITNVEANKETVVGTSNTEIYENRDYDLINSYEEQQILEAKDTSKSIEAGTYNNPAKSKAAYDYSTFNNTNFLDGSTTGGIKYDWLNMTSEEFAAATQDYGEEIGPPLPSDYGSSGDVTSKGYKIEVKDGITYVGGLMIANKTYSLPSNYNPGKLTSDTQSAFNEMVAAAKKDNISLDISSGYRSYSTQKGLYDKYVARDKQEGADTYSARPGHSEHQTGYSLDVNMASSKFTGTKEQKWLAAHCAEYGFIIRYPKGKEDITGYQYESWHIRYVGKELAKEITDSGLCLEEYLGITSKYNN